MSSYPIGTSGQRLIFTAPVLAHFERYRQVKWWHREAGGQLFARFALPDIFIEEATGPRRLDWRTRTCYRPNRRLEQQEIISRHQQGSHFVGDWHTHPDMLPIPSRNDEESMREMFAASTHALNGFVLVIVGTERPPRGLYVSVFGRTFKLVLETLA
jgi:integrative and conjugative element protein (TIGR02256 family)